MQRISDDVFRAVLAPYLDALTQSKVKQVCKRARQALVHAPANRFTLVTSTCVIPTISNGRAIPWRTIAIVGDAQPDRVDELSDYSWQPKHWQQSIVTFTAKHCTVPFGFVASALLNTTVKYATLLCRITFDSDDYRFDGETPQLRQLTIGSGARYIGRLNLSMVDTLVLKDMFSDTMVSILLIFLFYTAA